jgi:hypothetical protein
MEQDSTAFNVSEEPIAKAASFARTCDQAGDVGDDKFDLVNAHNAKVGDQRGKWVVSDLGPGVRRRGKESRFASVWHTKQAYICNKL